MHLELTDHLQAYAASPEPGDDVDFTQELNEELIRAAKFLTTTLQEVIDTCEKEHKHLRRVEIQWKNMPTREFNPDGNRGFFRVVAYRTTLRKLPIEDYFASDYISALNKELPPDDGTTELPKTSDPDPN